MKLHRHYLVLVSFSQMAILGGDILFGHAGIQFGKLKWVKSLI